MAAEKQKSLMLKLKLGLLKRFTQALPARKVVGETGLIC